VSPSGVLTSYHQRVTPERESRGPEYDPRLRPVLRSSSTADRESNPTIPRPVAG
jgi:hypothetical protein